MFVFALIGAAIVIVVAGTVLARSGEKIADLSGIGQVWFGAIFVAAATSLPGLATDTAAVLQDEPELAVGDLSCSNMANMATLGLLAVLLPAARVDARDALELTITGSVAVILIVGLTAMALRAQRRRSPIETNELVMLGGYAVAMLLVWSVGASS